MNILRKLFLSVESMTVMLIIFAVAIGAATFLENDFGTESAKVMVYNAKWFEVLLVLLAINLIYNAFSYKMWKKGKRLSLLFHVSFLVILLGAATTRYIGFEGTMHIREGGMSNIIESSEAFLQLKVQQGQNIVEKRDKILLSPLKNVSVSQSANINGKKVSVKGKEFVINAGQKIKATDEGMPLINLMISQHNQRQNVILKQGDDLEFSHFILSFGGQSNGPLPTVHIKQVDNGLSFTSNTDVTVTSMSDQSTLTLASGEVHDFEPLTLYSIGSTVFVQREFVESGIVEAVPLEVKGGMGSGKKTVNALVVDVIVDGQTKQANLFGGRGISGDPVTLRFNDVTVDLAYGAINIGLPFALELVDFEIERYPGSNSPSSYASEVVLKDQEKNIDLPFRIYMNHILHHRGYRFFQSSYDQDELGTILSVSFDPGTTITYLGYILLAIGLIFNFFVRKSRFRTLSKLVKTVQAQKAALLFIMAIIVGTAEISSAQSGAAPFQINQQHANRFGELLVQDSQGRLKPMNTLGHEVLHKVARKNFILGLDANQVMLGMLVQPAAWHNVDMFRIKHPVLKATLGLEPNDKYANFNDFFDPHTRQYKLSSSVEAAQRKKPSQHDKLDKELIKVDERLSICYMIYMGRFHRIFPIQNDPNHTWTSQVAAAKSVFGEEQQAINEMMTTYLSATRQAMNDGNWDAADAALETIISYQKQYGGQVYPSESKIKAEIFFNNVDVFGRLSSIYLLSGVALLIIAFIRVFRKNSELKIISLIFAGLLALGFIAQTAGLALRWYVSGHAPWSNGYESMIYIAWATVLAGLFFTKREPMPLAATSVLAGLTLFVAHLNWMDPQITNLVPVLKSYWLMIHVSLITASYGFLGLGAILAFLTLLLFSFKTKKNSNRVELSIKELSMINEQTLIVGLVMLTIGNFLGAVWANESWGRYWGWDPKETWALVTILVYSAVVHFRLIPKLKSFYAFNVGALLSFGSVIMTYFGVNYYLSGLHSYAAGDPVPIPVFVYYVVAIVFIILIASFRGRSMGSIE